jgi:hypothetical protein
MIHLQVTVSDVAPYQGSYAQQSRAVSGTLAFTIAPENLDATMASMRSTSLASSIADSLKSIDVLGGLAKVTVAQTPSSIRPTTDTSQAGSAFAVQGSC